MHRGRSLPVAHAPPRAGELPRCVCVRPPCGELPRSAFVPPRPFSSPLRPSSWRLRCASFPPRPSSSPPRPSSWRLRCASFPPRPSSSPPRPSSWPLRCVSFRLGLLPLRFGLLPFRFDSPAFRLGLSLGVFGPLLLGPGRLRLLLRQPFLLLHPARALDFLAALALDHRKPFLLFVPACRKRRLLLLQRLDASRLRFALARELGEALRLLAFTLALGRDVLPLALALHAFELPEPAFLLRSALARRIRLPFELLDAFAFLPALAFVALAQALELFGELPLVDDHRLDRLRARADGHLRGRVSESEDQHGRDRDVKQCRVHERQHPIRQCLPAHCGAIRGASVISPTLGAPARCRTVIRVTTSP